MTIKKTLIYLGLAVFGFSSCQQNQHADLTTKVTSLDSDTVSVTVAKQYVNNYAKHAGFVDSTYTDVQLSKVKKLPNSRTIWFGIDRLQAMVNKIKAEGGDGVRFYLATYDTVYTPNSKHNHIPERKYWGHTTLVMVSTKDSLKFHRDYYSNSIDPSSNSKSDSKGFILGVGSAPENRGEMCPPPSNCATIGATLITQ
ncbi:hypothetical protein [Mucilaginibacter sp. L196]|uniref:hypothetical protein n=1 Tax=Mucilaginibacter sp. L196 TaxID=1641870 RepID=UPI00131D07D1|nr:hypothetical protein [Mucilaginibacter sp. L196]